MGGEWGLSLISSLCGNGGLQLGPGAHQEGVCVGSSVRLPLGSKHRGLAPGHIWVYCEVAKNPATDCFQILTLLVLGRVP